MISPPAPPLFLPILSFFLSLSHTFFFSSELISFLFGNVCVHVYLYQKISLSHLHDIFLKRLLYIKEKKNYELYIVIENKIFKNGHNFFLKRQTFKCRAIFLDNLRDLLETWDLFSALP